MSKEIVKYDWVPVHKGITLFLAQNESNQKKLIELLKSAGATMFNDKVSTTVTVPLEEIDPFTFYCYIYKYGPDKRLKILQNIAKELNLDIPTDESGIPSTNAQQVWMFPYKVDRNNNEIPRLWNLFRHAISNTITDELFADALTIKGTGKTKLTEALFMVDPEKYFPINGPTKPYLIEDLGINSEFDTYQQYINILSAVKSKSNLPFHELSFEAWKTKNEKPHTNYWIFQGNPKAFDFATALKQEILSDWTVSAHKDKIKIGDKVILWITGPESGCYALAEVTSEAHIKTNSTDNHLWKEIDKNELKAGIKITHNMVDNPILKSYTDSIDEFKSLKVGNQGTNFTSTEEEYNKMESLAKSQVESFQAFIGRFNSSHVKTYFDFLAEIVAHFHLSIYDQRLVFTRTEKRLNFIIGQRYCFNLSLPNSKDTFGVISSTKLTSTSESFGGTGPKLFYNEFSQFDPSTDEKNSIFEALDIELKRVVKSGFRRHNWDDFENHVFGLPSSLGHNQMNPPLNTIFYGPPGTGKTFLTIQRAAEIIEKREIKTHAEALSIFNKHLHTRIEFITFHQNYSYEDFIQGLRPDIDNESSLNFKKIDGVFKKIADRAFGKNGLTVGTKLKDYVVQKVNDDIIVLERIKDGLLRFIPALMISELMTALKDGIITIEDLTNRKNGETHIADVIGSKVEKYFYGMEASLFQICQHLLDNSNEPDPGNHVIIIDEINRANISRVFGELITLIELDKRSHGSVPLSAKLPSGDTFMIPSNLYIIGTMNTADKSIALLDIALRRRFEFEPMYPKYKSDGLDVRDDDILRLINEKIKTTKGHDFQIGHSYFMDSKEDPYNFLSRMNKKVVPLLLEYYMNDSEEVFKILEHAKLIVDKTTWPIKVTGKA